MWLYVSGGRYGENDSDNIEVIKKERGFIFSLF